MIFSDFFKAVAQVSEPDFRNIALRSILLTLVALALVAWGFWKLLPWLLVAWIGRFDEVPWFISFFAGFTVSFFAFVALSAFLMVPVTMTIIGLFADEIVNVVERRHYPHLASPKVPGAWSQFGGSLKFFAVVVAANAIALAIYTAIPPLAPFIFLAMNGYLLGREYFSLCAERRERKEDAEKIRKRNGATIWLAGSGFAFLLTVPIVNLFAPLIGIASFTHTYHRYRNFEFDS
ncbi:MAG: EI24 domain-containing protein [Albidovulum sp.]|nr:EI24 domain-containing protein [Albidovulum sp.]